MNQGDPVHRLGRGRAHIVELYVLAVAVASVLVILSVARVEAAIDHSRVNWWAFGAFALLLVIAETRPSFTLRLTDGGEVTPGWAFAFALVLLGSPLSAVACSAIATLLAGVLGHRSFVKIIFNTAQVTTALGLGAIVLDVAGLSGPALSAGHVTAIQVLGIAAAGLTVLVTNAVFLFVVIALMRGVSVRVPLREGWLSTFTADGAVLAISPIFVIAVDYSLWLLPMLAITSSIVFTSARQAVRQTHAATHDPLTQLRNRAGLHQALQARLGELTNALEGDLGPDAEHRPLGLVMLLIDLDGFKEVNDRLGHATGDALLAALAARMERVIPSNAVAARLGGDEFAILLECTGTVDNEVHRVHELRNHLSQTLLVNGFPLTVGMSIGVSCAPLHTMTGEQLLGYADVAMYRAKRLRTGVELYGTLGEGREHGRINLLGSLAKALGREQLSLAYQPQVRISTGQCEMVEALLRWEHPSLGSIPPGEFIAVAEHTDLIVPITEFAIRQAVHDLVLLADEAMSMAVNVSARNLQDRHFPERVLELLDDAGLEPARLELEITESALASDPLRTRFAIDALRSAGVRIAIDDFGTGYSSFSSLRDVEVDRLKIDRSFTSRITGGAKDEVLVRSIIQLAAELGLETVAEGIEDAATWALLRTLGCDIGQGYAIAQPLHFHDLRVWLNRPGSSDFLDEIERRILVD